MFQTLADETEEWMVISAAIIKIRDGNKLNGVERGGSDDRIEMNY